MTCSCGHPISTEAESREEAVAKLKGEWTPEMVDSHMKEKHPGETMTVEQAHAQIEQSLEPAE